MVRNYLQVGGGYVENTDGEHVFQDQMYVEHLAPVNGTTQQYPLVMIHGTAQTATVSVLGISKSAIIPHQQADNSRTGSTNQTAAVAGRPCS